MDTDARDRLEVALALLQEMRDNRAIAPHYKQDVADVLAGAVPRRLAQPTMAVPSQPDTPKRHPTVPARRTFLD